MPNILKIVDQYDHMFASAGIHPHHALEAPSNSLEQLQTYAKYPAAVGIGETGLVIITMKQGMINKKLYSESISLWHVNMICL